MKLDVLFDGAGLSMDEVEKFAWQLCHLHGVSSSKSFLAPAQQKLCPTMTRRSNARFRFFSGR